MMIKHINKLFTIITVICLFLVGLIYNQYKKDTNKTEHLIIGTSYMTMNNSFYTAMNNEIAKEVRENNDIIYTRDPVLDIDKQNEQIHDLVDLDVDVLIVNPVNYSKIDTSLKYAKDHGVKIIIIDAPIKSSDLADCTIVSNNYDAGAQCAKDMMKHLTSANIILLEHKEALSAVDRIKGFEDTIKNNKNYKIIDRQNCLGQTEVALPLMKQSIVKHPQFNVVFALNDPSALGALAAIKEQDIKKQVYVYSVDGSPDTKKLLSTSNEIRGTASQAPILMGKRAVETAYKMADNKEYESSIIVPVTLITKDNIDKYDISGWQ